MTPDGPTGEVAPGDPGQWLNECTTHFDAIDADGSGSLDEEEGKVFLTAVGAEEDELDYYWQDMLRCADSDQDGNSGDSNAASRGHPTYDNYTADGKIKGMTDAEYADDVARGAEPCLPGTAAPAEPIIATAVEDLDEAAAELWDEELFDADVQQAASSDTPPGVFTAVMSRTAEEELEPALYRQRKRQQQRQDTGGPCRRSWKSLNTR